MTDNNEKAVGFVRKLRPLGPWTVASIDPANGAISVAMFKGEAEIPSLLRWISERNGKVNLYFIPNPTKRRLAKKPSESDLAQVEFAHVDCDPLDGESPPEASMRHRAALEAHDPPPTLVWSSGNGIAALWKLAQPIKLQTMEHIAICKGINKAIIDRLGGKAKGYDNCQSLDHLLRLPFTLNLPNAKKLTKGRKPIMAGDLVVHDDRSYYLWDLPVAAPSAVPSQIEIGEPITPDKLPEYIVNLVQADVPKGERSEHVFGCICKMIREHMPNEDILGVLLNAEFKISERILERGTGAEAFARKEIARAHARIELPPTAEEEFVTEPDATVDANKLKSAEKYRPYKISELMALPPPKWLIRSVLIEGGLFEIYGRFKSGKTFWAIEMACCIATGHNFFDVPATQGKVLYVIAEGSRKLFGYRIKEWAKERSNGDADEFKRLLDLIEDNIDIVPVAVHIDVDEEVGKFIFRNPGVRAVVFIDTLFRSMAGDVMKSGDMVKFIAGCDRIRHKLKAAVIFLHHQKRNDAKGGFGSIVGEASVDGAAKVSSPRKLHSVFRLELLRDGDAGVKPWTADIRVRDIDDTALTDGDVGTTGVLVLEGRGGPNKADDLLQIIKDFEPKTVDDLAAQAHKSKPTVERYLKTLREKALLTPRGLKLTTKGVECVIDVGVDDCEDYENPSE